EPALCCCARGSLLPRSWQRRWQQRPRTALEGARGFQGKTTREGAVTSSAGWKPSLTSLHGLGPPLVALSDNQSLSGHTAGAQC
ncbi:unnamed protein product, partial [Bubo scandiacus]